MSFIAIASPVPEVIYCLNDDGALWVGSMSAMRQWEWKTIDIPEQVQPVRAAKQEQWKPFGAPPDDGQEKP